MALPDVLYAGLLQGKIIIIVTVIQRRSKRLGYW
jgi:hypothetical protein